MTHFETFIEKTGEVGSLRSNSGGGKTEH
jgi:hypothetical protein